LTGSLIFAGQLAGQPTGLKMICNDFFSC